jgi:tetratricopeptide (TPR) repeat protein
MIETGRFTAAHDIYERVTAREPFWAFAKWRVADCLLALGRLEEAEEQIEIGWRLWPRSFNFWLAKLQYLLVSGQEAEALRFARDDSTHPLDFDAPVPREILVAQYLADRSAASLQRARDALIAYARKDVAVAAMELPFIGEVDAAFEMYEGYFLNRGPWKAGPLERRYTGGLFEVTTAQLRKDARFIPLLRAIGLEHYYQVAGVEPDFMLA